MNRRHFLHTCTAAALSLSAASRISVGQTLSAPGSAPGSAPATAPTPRISK